MPINFDDVKHITIEEYFTGNEFAINTFRDKYSQVKDDGTKETPAEVWRRVASEIASMEETEEKKEYWTNRWFSELWEGWWRPGGSIISGAAPNKNRKVSLSNCTGIVIKEDSLESIFEAAYTLAKDCAYRQGIGVDFSRIRPRGTRIHNSAEVSTGAIHWMRFFDGIANYVGQCLAPSTRILTEEGYKRIEDVVRGKEQIRVVTHEGLSRIVGWHTNGEKLVYKITTEYGDCLFASEDHELLVASLNGGEPRKKKISELNISDSIVSYIPNNDFGEYVQVEPFEYLRDSYNNSNRLAVPVKTPTTVNEDLAYLLGYVYGNGSFCCEGVEISVPHAWPEIEQRLQHTIFNLFGVSAGEYGISVKRGDGKCNSYRLGSYYRKFFEHCGFAKGCAASLGFPNALKKSPKSVLLAFFAGLFDADGYRSSKKCNISLALKDFEFLYELKLELAKFGIITRLKGKVVKSGMSYLLSRVGRFGDEELKSIGSIKLSRIALKSPKYDRLKTPYKAHYLGIKPNLVAEHDINNSDFLSASKYLKYVGTHCNFYIQGIRDIQAYDTMVTYDITIDNQSHLFSAENFIVSNSGRIPAMLLSINVGHPDVEEFIKAKSDLHSIQNANISVQITDAFMEAVLADKEWELKFEVKDTGEKVSKTVRARDLMRLISERACNFAEPGVQFLDTIQRMSNTTYLTDPETGEALTPLVSNACSEKMLYPNSTCVLGSINMGMFNYFQGGLDYKGQLDRISVSLVRFLDNTVSYELKHKRYPIPEQGRIVEMLREIGCGITNLHQWVLNQGLEYDSDEAIRLVSDFVCYFAQRCYKASCELGKEKGNFKAFDAEKILQSPFIQKGICITPPTLRNSLIMSFAPTGTLSLTFPHPTLSTGIEPAPGFYYWKRSRVSGAWKWYFNLAPAVNTYMKNNFGISWDWTSIEDPDGKIGESTIQVINEKLGELKGIFKPAHMVDPLKKVELMARMARYVDSSISTTYNLPETATPELVEQIYMEAWKKGVKSVAVYRDKSRQGVIEFESPPAVEKRFTICADTLRPDKIARRCAPKRPKELPCEIHQITVKGQKWIVPVGIYEGEPFEVFAGKSDVVQIPEKLKAGKIVKHGKNKYALIIPIVDEEALEFKDMALSFQNDEQNALTRQISLNLRTGTHLQFIVEQLRKGAGSIADFSAAIARVLGKYIKPVVTRDEKCPHCGNDSLDRSQGCVKCVSCGWSRCE